MYALYDKYSKQIYVGMTKNLEQRLEAHAKGKSFFTRRFKSFAVIYTEECKDYKEGRGREKYLKAGSGKEFLKTKQGKPSANQYG